MFPLYIVLVKAYFVHGNSRATVGFISTGQNKNTVCVDIIKLPCHRRAETTLNIKWNNVPHICHGHTGVCVCVPFVRLCMPVCVSACACARPHVCMLVYLCVCVYVAGCAEDRGAGGHAV